MDTDSSARRLLDWMQDKHPGSPLKRIKGWFEDGRVTLDGKPVRKFHERCDDPGARLQLGETVSKQDSSGRQRARGSDFRIRDTRLRLVHMDEDLIVVDKDAGLLSVPARGVKAASALEILRAETGLPIQPVHRLDRFTSGLICFAVSPSARESLIEALRAGDIHRGYIAFVEGAPDEKSGTWKDHLELDKRGDQQIADQRSQSATLAVTHFYVSQVLKRGPVAVFSKLKLTLDTGLKHQIRLQAASAGVPLLGDRGYHTKYMDGDGPLHIPIDRQALHAWNLELPHPSTGEPLRFESPLARDMARLQRWMKEK